MSVAARILHQVWFRSRDIALGRGSLFPFFGRDGTVTHLMLVRPGSPRILWLPHRRGLVRTSRFGFAWIGAALGREAEIDPDADLAGLWHYDPWWVLADERFAGHPAVPALKETNCAARFTSMVFAGGLDRVEKAVVDGRLEPWSPDLVPLRGHPRVVPFEPRVPMVWRLRPRWERPRQR